MGSPTMEALAYAEIDEYREQLVPADLVERKMRELTLELLTLGQAGQGEGHAILLRTAAYLKRVAGWTDVDPRLRLDCVCTLCWTKRGEALEALPPELPGQLGEDWAEVDDLLGLWERRRPGTDDGRLARMLTWWWVAGLVGQATHLAEGEALDSTRTLLEALNRGGEAGPTWH